jgi:hypothetical protein
MDKEFVNGYNSIFGDILKFFGLNAFGTMSYPKNNDDLSMSSFAAAQYCMTCLDQTFLTTLVLPQDGPSEFINYRKSFSNDTFAN